MKISSWSFIKFWRKTIREI